MRKIGVVIGRGLVALLLALLLGEGAVRATGWTPVRLRRMARVANTKGSEVGPGTVALSCYPTNPRGYFMNLAVPSVRAHYESLGVRHLEEVVATTPFAVEQRYNSRIFRGGEFAPKRSGVRRVVLLGTSISLGWGVKEEDTYARRMEVSLNRWSPGHWEVLNCARANLEFPRLWFLFREVLALEPDVIVYAMSMNDPDRSRLMQARYNALLDLAAPRGGPLASAPPTLKFGILSTRLGAIFRDQFEARREEQELIQWYLDAYSQPNHAGWRRTKEFIRNMDDQVESRGARFLLVSWPVLMRLEAGYPFDPVHEKVDAFCRKFGIRHHDLLGAFRGRKSSSLWVHPVDHHPNEIAHALAADDLAPAIMALPPVGLP